MEKGLYKKINLTIERNFDDQIKFLQKLVITKSDNPFTPENSSPDNPIEIEVVKLIKQKLEEFGLSPEFKGVSLNRPNIIVK